MFSGVVCIYYRRVCNIYTWIENFVRWDERLKNIAYIMYICFFSPVL